MECLLGACRGHSGHWLSTHLTGSRLYLRDIEQLLCTKDDALLRSAFTPVYTSQTILYTLNYLTMLPHTNSAPASPPPTANPKSSSSREERKHPSHLHAAPPIMHINVYCKCNPYSHSCPKDIESYPPPLLFVGCVFMCGIRYLDMLLLSFPILGDAH